MKKVSDNTSDGGMDVDYTLMFGKDRYLNEMT